MAEKRALSVSPDASGRDSSQAPSKRRKATDDPADDSIMNNPLKNIGVINPIIQPPIVREGSDVPFMERFSRKFSNSKRPPGETTINFTEAPPKMAPLRPPPQLEPQRRPLFDHNLRFQALRNSRAQQMGSLHLPNYQQQSYSSYAPGDVNLLREQLRPVGVPVRMPVQQSYNDPSPSTTNNPVSENCPSGHIEPMNAPKPADHRQHISAQMPIGTIPHNLMNNVTPAQLGNLRPGVTVDGMLGLIAKTPSSGPQSAAALARAAISSTPSTATPAAGDAATRTGPRNPALENGLAPIAPDDQILLSRSALNLVFARLIAARKMSQSWIAEADRALEKESTNPIGMLSDVTVQARMIDMAIEQITSATTSLRDGAQPTVKYHELRDPDGKALGE